MNNKSRKIYLGVDWGEKRIGLALADSETKLATPFKLVGAGDVAEVVRIVKNEEIDLVVVGRPVQITNYELPITNEKYNEFIDSLKKKIDVPVKLVDERLSSKAADALIGTKKTKASRDEIAAMIILQSWLDTKETNKKQKVNE